MKDRIKQLIDKLPYVRGLRREVNLQGKYPAGSYYSPIPHPTDVADRVRATNGTDAGVPGIDLRAEEQKALLQDYARYYPEVPFADGPANSRRYHFGLTCLGHADAIFLYSFLRHFRPRRIVEVQTGASSGLMLDTLEQFGYGPVNITFVDGHWENVERLRLKLKQVADHIRPAIVEQWAQKADAKIFAELQAGDLLFIASSHVVKYGSDLQRILFEILPALAPGVFVHFHNIFYPFEYPADWLTGGTHWNECYFLRAFLAYNDQWEVVLFNDWARRQFGDYLRQQMPLTMKTPGTGLYLRRKPALT